MNLRILLLSRYDELGASSRYRSFQFLPYLRKQGWEIDARPLFDSRYLYQKYTAGSSDVRSIVQAYLRRILSLGTARDYDLIWIEKEVLPFLPAMFELGLLRRRQYIVDYDDAIFHNYDGHSNRFIRWFLGSKIDHVMRQSSLVMAGNPYIASRAVGAGSPRVEVIPTVVDLDKYPEPEYRYSDSVTVGWIGTPMTAKFLSLLEPVFRSENLHPSVEFRAIGSGTLAWKSTRHSVVPWSSATEVMELSKLSIGVMPLVDSAFERGKSGLKLLQYMAVGIPVIASPVGVNTDIVEHGVNGFLARTEGEWISAINLLARDPELRHRMGRAGRDKVETEYSLQNLAPRLAQLIGSIVTG